MGMGKRLVMALAVIAALLGSISTPQLPARAAEPVVFEHVFSDGDPLNKIEYQIPDDFDPCFGNDFVFRQGSYVLLISASVAAPGAAAPVPDVSGKGLTWEPIYSQAYDWDGSSAMFAVFQAWADDPEADPTNEASRMTFDFGAQTQDYHTRTFIQTAPGTDVDRTNPRVQTVPASGTGTSAGVTLDDFDDAISDAAVLAVVKHSNAEIPAWSGVTEIADTTPGTGECREGNQPHRVGAGVTTGEVADVSASWTGSADWRAVAFEINAEGPPTATTTSTASTATTAATTTTTGGTPPTTVVGTPPPGGRFTDDDTSVFETDIERIAQAGITLGCNPPTNDRFCPDDTMTRGQMAAFLSRALQLTGEPTDRFADDDTSVFETDIERIAQAGITLGCNPPTNDRFCPDDTMTRGQMAAFLSRALQLTGEPTDRFADDDTSVFETDIERIAQVGITLGCNPPTNDRFCPDDTMTRGQMAAFLSRMLDYLAAN